jgi:hypothetical protein
MAWPFKGILAPLLLLASYLASSTMTQSSQAANTSQATTTHGLITKLIVVVSSNGVAIFTK